MIPRTALATALFAALAFSQARPSAQPANRMEISLERLDVDNWRSIDPGLVLEQGDRIRFVFHASFDGYLYVTNLSSSGKHEQLFPREETGQDNRIAGGSEYRVPATSAAFRIAGPPGHETVYWLVSPVRLTDGPPHLGPSVKTSPPTLVPRCDDTLLRSRGDCIDTSAGPKLVPRDIDIPPSLSEAAERSKRDLLFMRKQDTAVISSPAPLDGPVIYVFLLAHR